MRIALVVNGFPVLSETFIYNQAAGLQRAGLDVTVITSSDHDDAAMFENADGARYTGPIRRAVVGPTIAGTASRALSRWSPRAIALLDEARKQYGNSRRAVKAWLLALPLSDFDIVHLEYSGLAAAWCDALTLIAPTRVVVSCRGTAERITPHGDPRRGGDLRRVFSVVDRVHCVSADILRGCAAFGLDPKKAFVNHPAIDAARFARTTSYSARTSGPYQLVSTGRLIWAKGLEFGMLAVRLLIEHGQDVHYTIVGAGPDEERLRFAVHDLGLQQHVTMLGRQSSNEVRSLLERSDLYLLPSVSEGMSNAALEAMAMELPVVSTSVGGMPEAIESGRDGVLVRSREPAEMAARIAELLEDPARRMALGRAARKRIERDFSIERQLAVFVAEYEALQP